MSKAKDAFTANINRLDLSGCGVVFCRGREPQRIEEALREFATTRSRPFRRWNMIYGWRVATATGVDAIEPVKDPLGAIRSILDIDGGGAKPTPVGTVALFDALHPWLTASASAQPNPMLIALLREYARLLTDGDRRRVFISVPETFTLPEDLVYDIPVVDMDLPDAMELQELLQGLLINDGEDRGAAPQTYTAEEMKMLAKSAAGLTVLEAESAGSQALIDFRKQLPNIPFDTFNARIMSVKAEAVKASGFLRVMDPVNIEDVGGLDLFKEWIYDRAEDFTPAAQESGVKSPRGVTFIGPPGTGKTLSASVVSYVLKRPALSLDFAALFGGIVGQTEANVRRVIKDITALGECIIFADEIDRTMGMNQSGGDGGITKRLIGTLLQFMQSNTSGAFFVFAANRAEGIDSALVRKGRIDEVFGVNVPNSVERMQILRIHLRKAKRDPEKVQGLQTAVAGSAGYVGAELECAVQRAASESHRTGNPITGAMILEHVVSIKPLSVSFKADFDAMAAWAENNAVPASTPEKSISHAPAVAPGSVPARRRRLGNN